VPPNIQRYFCTVYDYAGEADPTVARAVGIPNENCG